MMVLWSAAVQQERRPPEPKEVRSAPILGSPAHRIFIRKDAEGLDSPVTGFLDKAEVISTYLTSKHVKECGFHKLVTFRVKRSRGKMYIGHGRLYVCLSLAAFSHYCTDPDVSWRYGRGTL